MGIRSVPYVSLALAVAIVAVHVLRVPLTPLSAQGLPASPLSVMGYMALHADAWHLGLNTAVLLAAGAMAERLGGHLRAALVAAVAVPAAGLAFCAATAAFNPGATLEGASSAAIALAAYSVTVMRARIPLMLLAALAATMVFGPNAGGGVAHCAGFAVGAGFGISSLRAARRRRSESLAEHARVCRKAEASGYSSLSDAERRLLETHSNTHTNV